MAKVLDPWQKYLPWQMCATHGKSNLPWFMNLPWVGTCIARLDPRQTPLKLSHGKMNLPWASLEACHGSRRDPWSGFARLALGRNVNLDVSTHGKFLEARPWQKYFAMAKFKKSGEVRKLLHLKEVAKLFQAQKLALGSKV